MSGMEQAVTTTRPSVSANPYVGSAYTANKGDAGTTVSQLNKVPVGSAFQGEVTDVMNRTVSIRLSNGQTIQATMKEPFSFNIGEKIYFQVKSNSETLIEIKPLAHMTEGIHNTILKALNAAGLPVNDRTVTMLKCMMDAQMPIDRNSLFAMHKQVVMNQNTDVATIVQMNKLQLPITEENIAQFENYKNFQQKLAPQAELLANEISQLLPDMVKEGNSQVKQLHGQLLAMLTQSANEAVQDGANPLQQTNANIVAGEGNVVSNGIVEQNGMAQGFQVANGVQSVNGEVQQQIVAGRGNQMLSQMLNPQEVENLANLLKESSLSASQLENITSGKMNVNEFFETMKQLQDSGMDLSDVIKDSGYQKLMKNSLLDSFLLSPHDVAKKENVEEYYSRLRSQGQELVTILEMAGKADTVAAKTVQGMNDNVDFMNQLNQMFTYIQLPLKMSENTAHGDLYVFTNKRNLQEKEGKLTALLHLDMTELGSMDIYVEMEKQNVSVKFEMEQQNLVEFLKQYIGELEERISSYGYNTTMDINVKEKEMDFVKDFLEHEQPSAPMQRFSFDVRA